MRSRKARDVTLSAWFNFVPDWSRERCEYLRPITELMNLAETKYNQGYPIRNNIETNIKNIRSHLQSLLLL